MTHTDTIAAIATPPGKGGVCIIRISGSQCKYIAETVIGQLPKPRYATFCHFSDEQSQLIDEGLALYFPAPHSYTGEDVLELHGHGGVIVSDMILQAVLQAGARAARPGEFSERAFLNDKLDLTQAEAVVDLIDAGSRQAARAAVRTLDGEFSEHIEVLLAELIELRVYIESALDFADEEIEFIQSGDIESRLSLLLEKIEHLAKVADRGRVLGEGLHIVIAGKPNAGKSSLMNALCGNERAIVTELPGTTRDVIRENVLIEGIPIHLHDTAGLRDQAEPIEQEGIRRAKDHVSAADLVLWVHDDTTDIDATDYQLFEDADTLLVLNKIDLSGKAAGRIKLDNHDGVLLSTATNMGMDDLRSCIAEHAMGKERGENEFSARRRHLDALEQTQIFLQKANKRLAEQLASAGTGELLAEELRQAQHALGEITGKFTSDDLLGKIFTEFCIGK